MAPTAIFCSLLTHACSEGQLNFLCLVSTQNWSRNPNLASPGSKWGQKVTQRARKVFFMVFSRILAIFGQLYTIFDRFRPTKNDQNWPKMVKNDRKWSKIVKKWPKMVQNGRKYSKIANFDHFRPFYVNFCHSDNLPVSWKLPKWSKMAEKVRKWLKTVDNNDRK